jgi:hypothetical protein
MTRIFAHRLPTSMQPLSSMSRKAQARCACAALMATLLITGMLLLSCVSNSSDHQSNNPPVNSGPAQVSAQITGAEGGKVNLPGVATLVVPASAISSTTATTVSITQVPLPIMDELSWDLQAGYKLLPVSRLRIKSSPPFVRPVFLEFARPKPVLRSGLDHEVLVSLVRQPNMMLSSDKSVVVDALQMVGGDLCLNDTAICVEFPPTSFQVTNPYDSFSPVLEITLASHP